MATTTSFNINRDQIITYALRKCGLLELGVTPDALTIDYAQTALNLMIKSWIIHGIKLWTQTEVVLPLVAGQTVYTLGPVGPDLVIDKPQRLIQAFLRNVTVTTAQDIPLLPLSNRDYNILGSKFSPGTPNSVYMNVTRDNAQVSFYLTPDSFTQTTYQAHLISQRLLQDATQSTDTLDFPQEWLFAIGWNLAAEIAIDNGLDLDKIQYIEGKAEKYLSDVQDWDAEYTSLNFAPDIRYVSR
jgi:hypothetical protein